MKHRNGDSHAEGRKARGNSRRQFLAQSAGTVVALAAADATARYCHAAEDNTINVALVGCGGRGTGAAANALSTTGPVKLVAMADVFEDRLQASIKRLKKQFGDKVDVPPERQFLGFDGYKKAIDTIGPGHLVLLTTPPAFRHVHLEYAVDKGVHVFMEKSFAVDAPGIRKVLALGKEAEKKNLKIATGLMSRHYKPLEETIARLHEGVAGNIITCWAYRMHGPVGFRPRKPDETELANQIRNYSCFTWLNGSFIVDWLIHNIDVCCWVKDQWPVSAQGQGGRQQRDKPDQLFDHFAVEFTFADGTRMFAQGRHMVNTWGFFGDVIHAEKAAAVLGEGQPKPKIYKNHQVAPDNVAWEYKGPPCNPYQVEHDLLFEAIRQDKPYNETERSAKSCMTAILGRMAAESGKLITWEEALASDLVLAPGLAEMDYDSPAPVKADKDGRYPIAVPGFTKAL